MPVDYKVVEFVMNRIVRTFLALNLPENIIASISRIQKDLMAYNLNIKEVKPENIHLTLKFLGNTRISDMERIHHAIKDVASDFSPFLLAAKGVGVFPDLRRPRVIWVGISEEIDRLVLLQKQLDKKLNEIGFNKEKQTFKGHLTIGRIKGNINRKIFDEILNKHEQFCTKTFFADRIYLLQSVLKPAGPIYSKLMSVQL